MSAAASAVTAFNLLCTIAGQIEGGVPVVPPSPERLVLVVDLSVGRFCYENCWETQTISRVTDHEIIFISKTPEAASEILSVNRESGYLTWEVGADDQKRIWGGRCEKAEFTGFPVKKF